MKLSQWAKEKGVSYQTAWRMFSSGKLEDMAEQLPSGTIIVKPKSKEEGGVALYARVSSQQQKASLEKQVARLTEYAVQKKIIVSEIVQEIGSGLNGHRKKLLRLLRSQEIKTIIVEHRDRLVRFGFEYIEALAEVAGKKIIVVDPEEMNDDLVRDLTEVMVSMCARVYGRRAAKIKAEKILKECSK